MCSTTLRLAVLLFVSGVTATAAAQTYEYRITEIHTVGNAFGEALNNAGHATGIATQRCAGCSMEAYLWTGKQAAPFFGPLSSDWFYSWGRDVNYLGQITGQVALLREPNNTDSAYFRAFFWDGSTKTVLGTLGGDNSTGNAINARGHIAGQSDITNSLNPHAFKWDGTTMHDLGTLGGCCSAAHGINNAGHVTGVAWRADNEQRAFLWDGTNMHDLGTLGGDSSFGTDINARGQVVGWSNAALGSRHAFVWQNGLMQDLGAIRTGPNGFAEATAINNAGQIVGFSYLADGNTRRAVLWENGKLIKLHDLNFANDPEALFITFTEALDINNIGQILVDASKFKDGVVTDLQAVLVSPAYKLSHYFAPQANSWRRGSTVRIAIAALDSKGVRIPDQRAVSLLAEPGCRVKVSATGAQPLVSTCMAYNATMNEFYFDWKLGSTGTGAATIDVRVNYGAPGPLKVIKRKTISITT